MFFLDASANAIGITQGTPTAKLHLGAGAATAGTAPLKFTNGTLNTTPEAGTIEYNSNQLYTTNSDARHKVFYGDFIRQTNDLAFTNNTFVDLPSMTFVLNAGSIYEIELYGRVTAGAGGARLRLLTVSGTWGRIDLGSNYSVGNGLYENNQIAAGGTIFAGSEFATNTAGAGIYTIKGTLAPVTTVTVSVQGAQNTTNAAPTTFWWNSYVKLTWVG